MLTSSPYSVNPANERLLSYFFKSTLNTEDNWYYPTSGIYFFTSYAYHTDNFVTYKNRTGYNDISVHWRFNATPFQRLTLQPGLFGRFLIGDSNPIFFANFLGTEQNIVEQQIYFPGIHSINYTECFLLGARLNLRVNITEKRYVFCNFATARSVNKIKNLVADWPDIFGLALGYAYNTFLGPLELTIGYSSLAPSLNFYLNIGHRF